MYLFARWSLAMVYIWFGALKLFDASPANPLVADLLARTIPFIGFEQFIIGLGIFEIIIGVLLLIPHVQLAALILLVPHVAMTTGPLLLAPAMSWTGFLQPSLEGQYIIKNILILALALVIAIERKSYEKRA